MSAATTEQLAAIQARGNVLVMAGAGTGKTRTLVDRCLAHLEPSSDPVSLDSILMVTFTEAAAGEMRARLRSALETRLNDQPNHPWWHEQYALIDTARISTLHAFCLNLLREHAHDLGLDPELIVLPVEQARILSTEVMDSLFERHYAGGNPRSESVQQLVLQLGRGWDQPVRDLVQRVHDYTQTLANPRAWFHQQSGRVAEAVPLTWLQWFSEGFGEWRALWLPELERLTPANEKASECAASLRSTVGTADRSAIASTLHAVAELDADWPRGTKKLRKPLESFFAEARFLLSLAEIRSGSDPMIEDWNWARPQIETLIGLVQEFGSDYAAAKRRRAAVDFHDLEQFALRLLWEHTANAPTPLARRWRNQLRVVFVDEYQDINEAQDTILRALGRDSPEGNRFLVGDVKQSIYRFRLANPTIFQGYADAWARPGATGTVRRLTDNFRSRVGILDFVNRLFSVLMHREVGGVEYTEDQWLRAGPATGHAVNRDTERIPHRSPDPADVELHVLIRNRRSADPEEDRSAIEREAQFVANRLRRLMAETMTVRDRETTESRPLRWGDVAVLLRSPRTRAEIYARTFAASGVPLRVERRGFFDSIEVVDLVSLLRILDNPLQDLPLLGVLRSPFAGLDPDDLAWLRIVHPRGRLWTALRRLMRHAEADASTPARSASLDHAKARAHAFLTRFQRWRNLARLASLSECLETVLDDSAYEPWLAASPAADEALANVRRLLHLTGQFDQFQRQGLHRFLQFVEALRVDDGDLEASGTEDSDAVRLLSVHQSKGLEFPVVVVADLGKRFNLQDLHAPIILDDHYGVCPMVRPPGAGQRYPSLTHWLARRRQRREGLGEELRLLYVACTRARERLILCGHASPTAVTQRWPNTQVPLTTLQLASATSWLEWLGPWMNLATGDPSWAQAPGCRGSLTWSIREDPNDGPLLESPENQQSAHSTPGDSLNDTAFEAIRHRFARAYPHLPATVMAAKMSVSQIRRRVRDEGDDEARPLFIAALPRRPRSQAELDPATVGLAHHRLLEHLPLDQPITQGRLLETVNQLTSRRILSRAESDLLDLQAVVDFWQSEPGRRIQIHARQVHRELPFTAGFSPADLAALGMQSAAAIHAAECVVVQGVADLAVLLPEGIWLVDFKTDWIEEDQLAERVREYTPQLGLYALALERIYQRPVEERWLHFLHLRRTVAPPPLPAPAPA